MAQTIHIDTQYDGRSGLDQIWNTPENNTIALQAARIAELEAKLETAEIALRKIQQTINVIGKIELILKQAGL